MLNQFRAQLAVGILIGCGSTTALLAGDPSPPATARVRSLDGNDWLLATDAKNVGRAEKWFEAPRPGAARVEVPWIIQDAFPGYHGVVWYWREFAAARHPRGDGRWILRFWAVDYRADVWLNGREVGSHEGGEGMFELDVTDAIRPGGKNLLAVRVLNPTDKPIDGYKLRETPARNKSADYKLAGAAWDTGGITDSVELIAAPAARLTDLWVRPDWKTGVIRVQATVRNAGNPTAGNIRFSVAPAMSGETIAVSSNRHDFPHGDTIVDAELRVPDFRLWELGDPNLYRVTARIEAADPAVADERSVRCGFRDFRFADGYFRLNGRRIFLRSSHTGNCCPIGQNFAPDPDMLRRDLLNVKVMGFNTIRFIAGMPLRSQLDLCDELGLMVQDESYASWMLHDSPHMAERADRSVREMIMRDRNHPCVVMWCLQNETKDGPVLRHSAASLPLVRSLDDTRVVLLNSGHWDYLPDSAESWRGLEIWRTAGGLFPNVTRNSTPHEIRGWETNELMPFETVWQPGQIGMCILARKRNIARCAGLAAPTAIIRSTRGSGRWRRTR